MKHYPNFLAVKQDTLLPTTSREHMKVSGNPDVFSEAGAKHGTAKKRGAC
jgi:hypothetical protein